MSASPPDPGRLHSEATTKDARLLVWAERRHCPLGLAARALSKVYQETSGVGRLARQAGHTRKPVVPGLNA